VLHVIHVAGTRMIWQGTDGLSRGDSSAGVMTGDSVLSFVPLHLSATDRSTSLIGWVREWWNGTSSDSDRTIWLRPDDWPSNLMNRKIYLWTPPPAAADAALEYFTKAIHKKSASTHIFLCPRLMTARWLRVLRKSCDFVLYIPTQTPVWEHQHEPLILAIYFPLSREYPWRH
jgi:hypothetical protein